MDARFWTGEHIFEVAEYGEDEPGIGGRKLGQYDTVVQVTEG
jgi:hypothetical protein